MSRSDDIAQAILDMRQELIASWLKGPEGSELLRLEGAYKALTGIEPPSIGAIASKLNGSLKAPPDAIVTAPTMIAGGRVLTPGVKLPRSVRLAAKELFEASDRIWSFDDIINQFERQGEMLKAVNVREALRTAVIYLVNEGAVERVGKGFYRGISKVSVTEAGGSLPSLGNGEVEG